MSSIDLSKLKSLKEHYQDGTLVRDPKWTEKSEKYEYNAEFNERVKLW
jgi:hypothetical protein